MHEASIILSILDTVTAQCETQGYLRINSISLRIGTASQILPDALQFAFEIAKKETIASGAELIIDIIPLTGCCQECSTEFVMKDRLALQCPSCQSRSIEVIKGYEMEIVEMEVD